MKYFFSFIIVFASFIHVYAQDSTTTPKLWKYEFIGSANGTQASYSNWAPGGVNTVSGAGSVVFKAVYENGPSKFASTTNLKYGGTSIENQPFRKSDDVISIRNRYDYNFEDSPLSLYGSANFQTQFYDGFVNDTVRISEFMAPAYLYESAGLAYEPSKMFNAQVGLTMKQTFVRDTTYAAGFGVDRGENFRNEAGLSLVANFDKEIFTNVKLTSSLETFTNLQISVRSTDIFFTNELSGKINEYLSTNLQLAFVYDDDISSEVQVKQVLSVGITYKFF